MCRPGGAQRKWGGIRSLIARADSVALAMRGQLPWAGCAATSTPRLPQGFAGQRNRRSGSVSLKNEHGDPSRIRISAFVGGWDEVRPQGARTTSARRSCLARHWGISPRYVAPSTCMRSTPDRKSRAVSGSRAGTYGESNKGPTQPCAAQSARARRDDGNSGSASGAGRVNCSNAGLVLGERLADDCQQCHALLYGLNCFGHGLKGPCRARLGGRGLKRRVTTATPFAPRWSRPGGLGSL